MFGQHHAPAALIPGKDPVPIVQDAGWVPEPVWIGAEYLAPPAFDPRTFQPVASRYTDYAIPAPPSSIIRVVKSRKRRWAGRVARVGERCAYRGFVGRPWGKRPLGKSKLRREDNIKMDFLDMGLAARTGLLWLRKGTGGGRL